MVAITSEDDFRELVLRHLERLPPQQQLIAEFLLGHLEELPFISVPSLASRIKVSEATVVRFAQRIGFDGFAGMKAALTELVRGRVASRGSEPALPEERGELLAGVIIEEIANIRQLGDEIRESALRDAAGAVFGANHVYCFGLGISSILADLSGYLLTQVGVRASILSTRFSSPLEQTVMLRPGDLLLVFSYPPFSSQTVAMVRDASERGIATVAVTDRLTAPVAPHASHLFRVRSNNRMYTNALGAATVFLNALVTEIAALHGDYASEAVGRINRILSRDENLIT